MPCYDGLFLDLLHCPPAEQNAYYLALAGDRWQDGWPSGRLLEYRRCLERAGIDTTWTHETGPVVTATAGALE